MDDTSRPAENFLAISREFRLGDLVTEQSHPATRDLSRTAGRSIPDALRLLFSVDADVISAYRKWAATDAPSRISRLLTEALGDGRKVYFTGCGATGRLSILLESVWRWLPGEYSDRAVSVMSGGDYALIKSVEGFEDFAEFGAKQIAEAGVSDGDVVFAITEGGETSFVIGTAWEALRRGAKVYFVYCNPDEPLRDKVTRSREVIDEPRIEKMNLTTGPMAITGSTRMQATSIQLAVMLTILEMTARDLRGVRGSDDVPQKFLIALEELHENLLSDSLIGSLSDIAAMEEAAYKAGAKSTYFADFFGIDVLTDTTERSPTFCTPAFRKWDDKAAADSWTYLITPGSDSETAWESILKRSPRCLSWTKEEIAEMIGSEAAEKQAGIMRQIGTEELLRFRISLDGLTNRPVEKSDAAICVLGAWEDDSFCKKRLEEAEKAGASAGLVVVGGKECIGSAKTVVLELPETDFLLGGIARVGVKMLLNALSTCVMVRMGRVLGNCMVAVVPSNLKLIDRSIRYIQTLTGLGYEDACKLLFESIEYVKPRMQAGQTYPPPVKLSVVRYLEGCSLEEAESLSQA